MQIERFADRAAALPEKVHSSIAEHLLRHIRSRKLQEDVCFAFWRPSCGATRLTAVLYQALLPEEGDRILAGNVSFTEQYFRRALTDALRQQAGLALLHSHLGPGWQNLSPDDHASEASFAGRVQATKYPLLGLTLATDESWSARMWPRGSRGFEAQ